MLHGVRTLAFPFFLGEFGRSFLKNDILSIDIGFTNIKVVHSRKKNGNALKVMNFGITATPPNCIKNGVISNLEGIAANLKKVVLSNGINEKNVKIVISAGSNIVSKVLYVKKDENRHVEELVKEEIPKHFPPNMHSYKLFYRVTGNAVISGEEHYKVLITIVPNTIINNYVKLVNYLDFRPLAIEIPFSSVARFFSRGVNIGNKELTASNLIDSDEMPIAIVDLGSETTNISVLKNGALEFNRIILMGGRNLDEEIARRLEVTRETAERLKKMYKADRPAEVYHERGTVVEQCVKEYLGEVLKNVKRSLDFYVSRCGGDTVGKIIFIGGGSGLGGLRKYAEEVIGVPAYTIDMMGFKNLELECNLDRDKLRYFVNAIGIAM